MTLDAHRGAADSCLTDQGAPTVSSRSTNSAIVGTSALALNWKSRENAGAVRDLTAAIRRFPARRLCRSRHTRSSPSFRAQEGSRTALLQRRRRLVLNGSEHGRTMIGSGEPTAATWNGGQADRSLPRGAPGKRRILSLSSHGTQLDAATIATRRAETRLAGLGRGGPWPARLRVGPPQGGCRQQLGLAPGLGRAGPSPAR